MSEMIPRSPDPDQNPQRHRNSNQRWNESYVPALLGSLDEDLLPDVDLDHGNLNYTVVIGEVLGNFEAEKKP